MSIRCLIDQSEHETVEAMHKHLRRFKVKQADYYTEYHPRKDLLTGDPIPFKDHGQYMSQDFLTKVNLKKWLKARPEEGREWAVNWLRRRKAEKGLVYAPSQVELRSLTCPTMPYYDSIGGYYALARELGFLDRYVSEAPGFAPLPDLAQVICDTREQAPLKLPLPTLSQKLDYGDYALAEPHDQGIYIERKSLNDFVGTLSSRRIERKKGDDSSFERLGRELARAAEAGHYVVMLIEASLPDTLSFEYLPQMKWTRASASHIFKNLRDLLTRFPLSFQAVFVDGRTEAASKLIKILQMGQQVRHIDLQHALEQGLL